MDLFAALVALGRRWYLTFLLLALVLGGTAVAAKAVKPDYKATASVFVSAPAQGLTNATNLGTVNPFLSAGTPTFANLISRVMTSDEKSREVVRRGGTSNYTVGQGATTNTPVLNIEATSSSPAVASKTASILIAMIGEEATYLQKTAPGHIPESSYITTSAITSGDKPSKLQGSRTRVVVAVGAMGIVLTFGTVLLLDSWLMARRARLRRTRGARGDGADADGDGDESSNDGSTNGQDLPLARVRP